jgi:para-aminobenzoate synthetase component I
MPQKNLIQSPPLSGAAWQPIPSSLACDLPAGLSHLPGFVWLDDATEQGCSYLTAQPTQLSTGNIHDAQWGAVQRTLRAATEQGQPGGLFGYIGFHGDFCLGFYPAVMRYDAATQQWQGWGAWSDLLKQARSGMNDVPFQPLEFSAGLTETQFIHQVERAQEYIQAGDIYQVNLAYPWTAQWPPSASFWPYYERLRQASPAPYGGCLSLGGKTLLSASPELFVRLNRQQIITRPIKGTRLRFPEDPLRDAQAAEELLHCEKERAELLMITDLERNDLGQVCVYGSVQVTDLWQVESFAQVHHMVSTVQGQLRPEIDHAMALRACFPGGSISGAPKKRALEIIQELEPHPRGVYTGAMGYFLFDGTAQWNITIRTGVLEAGKLHFHVGSGIVADSQPSREWQETLHKASGLLKAWAHSPSSRSVKVDQ